MTHFNSYVSNTIAGASNQFIFSTNQDTSRAFYKITRGGKYTYSLVFTNTIDSTFADGAQCQKNVICSQWEILGARVCTVRAQELNDSILQSEEALASLNNLLNGFVPLTFGGKSTKQVAPAEIFSSDEIELDIASGDYLCLELTYKGEKMPYHEEAIIPICKKTSTSWHLHKKMPLPAMVGIKRETRAKIGFIGDSITQGIGVPLNHYTHWNAIVARELGDDYAYWNLGIGFGRANDIASLGAWFNKALQNDVLVVCYGVNDIMQGFSENQVKNDLKTTVMALKKAGKRVILQTVPPFDYNEEKKAIWEHVNDFIKTELAREVDLVFDVVPYLGKSEEEPQIAKFGGHPNEDGCAIWGLALSKALKDIL